MNVMIDTVKIITPAEGLRNTLYKRKINQIERSIEQLKGNLYRVLSTGCSSHPYIKFYYDENLIGIDLNGEFPHDQEILKEYGKDLIEELENNGYIIEFDKSPQHVPHRIKIHYGK